MEFFLNFLFYFFCFDTQICFGFIKFFFISKRFLIFFFHFLVKQTITLFKRLTLSLSSKKNTKKGLSLYIIIITQSIINLLIENLCKNHLSNLHITSYITNYVKDISKRNLHFPSDKLSHSRKRKIFKGRGLFN